MQKSTNIIGLKSNIVSKSRKGPHVNPVKTQFGGSARYRCFRNSAAVGLSSGFLTRQQLVINPKSEEKKIIDIHGKALSPEIVCVL